MKKKLVRDNFVYMNFAYLKKTYIFNMLYNDVMVINHNLGPLDS